MDHLPELTAAGRLARLAGATYTLLPLRLADWADAARHLRAARRGPLDVVKDHLPGLAEGLQRHLLTLAYEDERAGDLLPAWEVERWFASPAGRVFKLWLMLRQRHPEIGLQRAEELLLAAGDDELANLPLDDADQLGLPRGNSSSRTEAKAATPPGPASDASSPGERSSAA